jgi:GAF domain-containing protein
MPMSKKASTKRTFWEHLIGPHPSITEPKQRQRAQILAALTLSLLVIVILFMAVALLVGGRLPPSAWPVPALLLVSYLLSASPRPEFGAWLFVFGQAILNFIFLATASTPVLTPLTLIFVLVPILLSTLVLQAWVTITVSGLTVVGIVLSAVFIPWLNLGQILVPFIAIILLSALASATALIRQHDIETAEHQATDLSKQRQSLEEDVRHIMTMAEVGRTVTGTRDLDMLLKQIVNLITERFDFYHAQVFLLDEASEYAVLKASTGSAGRELLARGHRLRVGSQSVIGHVTAKGEPVIASDTDTDPVHRRNELLPHTRAEMALPLRVGGRVTGALDIQSVNPNAFRSTDVPVLQTMADQLAVAIENAHLFERAQRDLEEIALLNRQLTGEAWSKFLSGRSRSAPVGFKAKKGDLQPLSTEGEEAEDRPQPGAISLPLKVRGETIGVLDVMARDGEKPDDETRDMLEAVAERVALALDSARLGEQSQRRVAHEQVLSELSAELQATTDLDVILRAVARSASRALGTSRGFVHLVMEYGRPPE